MTVIPLHAYDASSAVKLTIVLFLVIFFLYYGRHIVVLLRRRAIVQRYALGRIIISPWKRFTEFVGKGYVDQELPYYVVKQVPILRECLPLFNLTFELASSVVKEAIQFDESRMHSRGKALGRLTQFLRESGADEEFRRGILKFPSIIINFFLLQSIHERRADDLRATDVGTKLVPCLEESEEALQEAYRMMKFCTVSYGAAMVNAVASANTRTSRRSSILLKPISNLVEACGRFTGLDTTFIEILTSSPTSDINLTSHMLLLDHMKEEAILALRGTWSISDFFNDLDCQQMPFLGGYAPFGMAQTTNHLWEILAPYLQNQIPEEYRFLIVGHSLGGSVGTLFTAKVIEEGLLPGLPITCHAFGAPPCFCGNQEVFDRVSPSIINYVHNDDLVFFADPHGVRAINIDLAHVDTTRRAMTWLQWLSALRGAQSSYARLEKSCEIAKNEFQRINVANKESGYPYPRCLSRPSAKTIWLRKHQGFYQAVRIAPQHRRGILLTKSSISDHTPAAYVEGLASVIGSLAVCRLPQYTQ